MTHESMLPARPLDPVRRFRDWVFACIVIGLTVTLCVVWGVWVTIRVGTYPGGVQEGGSYTNPTSGVEMSIISWRASRWMPDGDEAVIAPEGMVYLIVVARWRSSGAESGCTLEVVGRGQEVWTHTELSDDLPYDCLEEDRVRGSGVVYQNFVVPESKLGEIRGVRLPQSMRFFQAPLLRPAA